MKIEAPYLPPFGGPFYWPHEQTGVLPAAIDRYLNHTMNPEFTDISMDDLELVKAYFVYWVNAPCWERPFGRPPDPENLEQLLSLRRSIEEMPATIEGLQLWTKLAMNLGIDPL